MNRVTAINQSLLAFFVGLLGLIPVIGFLPSLWVLLRWSRVRTHFGGQWNPAGVYLKAGLILALLGILSTIFFVTMFVLAAQGIFN